MKLLQFLLLFLMCCSSEPKSNIIFIEISPAKLLLENREIEKRSFEKELKIVIDYKLKQGFKKEELVVNLKVDKQTRRGDIADLEVSLRRLNMRKIIYSTNTSDEGVEAGFNF